MNAYDEAKAAIEARRALIAAGTPGPWRTYDPDAGTLQQGRFGSVDPGEGMHSVAWPDNARLIVAAVNAFAADTDALAEVLERHWEWTPPDQDTVEDYEYCVECGTDYPCPDARAVLSALGVDHE